MDGEGGGDAANWFNGNRLEMSWKTDKNFTVKRGSDQTFWSALYLQNYLLVIFMCSSMFWEDINKES